MHYIRYFDQPHLQSLERLIWSRYFPGIMAKLLFDPTLRDADYLLCPVYDGLEDIQIGVTGKIQRGETFEEGFIRECGEEIGLLPVNPIVALIRSRGPIRWYGFLVPVVDTNFVPFDEELEPYPDQFTERVGGLIYGSHDEITTFLNQPEIIRYPDHDQIVALAAIPVLTARDHIHRQRA